ncbi:MAG: hypothetical protein HOV76_18035, partial [Hamadaea sp.]|nr:hypothetical protein [Hamadaea sp.]
AANAEAAAIAALEAAEHAGEAAVAAQRATEYANNATTAAQQAVDAAIEAAAVFDAARTADAERLAVARDEGLATARAANAEYEAQQRIADWDLDQAAKRDAETNRLIAVALDTATERATAVASARKVALNLAAGQGAWTKQAALNALGGADDLALEFVRTGIPAAVAQDNRLAVMNLAVTDNSALTAAAKTALAGSDQTVATFLRTQNYPGRYSADRLKVNQILTAAKAAGDVVLAQKAQQALDTDTLQSLRDFLDTGQYTAAVMGERVRVNQILNSPDIGPEVKAAAQIALDGPAPGLRQFLSTGRYTAAERDYESTIHVALAAGLLQKISQVAETAVQNALQAQSVAAAARDDAADAASYAQQAVDSANRAAGYAQQAATYANQAAASVAKAAAAVKTARDAATRATTSARSAIRSATWAIASYQQAVDAAESANRAARIAYDYAVAAGEDAEAAVTAQNNAYYAYETAYGVEIAKCVNDYTNTPVAGFEEYWQMPAGEAAGNCVRNLNGDPTELAERAYVNSALCEAMFPQGSQNYENCVNSALDPLFHGTQQLILVFETAKGLVLQGAIYVGAVVGSLCLLTVCGEVAGVLLTLYDVGTEIYRFIQGDQSLATTMLNIGTVALESLVTAGIGRVLSAGFRALKSAYAAAKTGSNAVSLIAQGKVTIQHLQALPGAWRMRAGNYSTERSTAFFWSGRTWVGPGKDDYKSAGDFSDEIAREMGGTTLEMLMDKRGIVPAAWDPDNKIVEDAWKDVSAAYARAASGEVRVILGTELRQNPKNVWEASEYEALCRNPNVTKIIKIDLVTRNTSELSCAQFK